MAKFLSRFEPSILASSQQVRRIRDFMLLQALIKNCLQVGTVFTKLAQFMSFSFQERKRFSDKFRLSHDTAVPKTGISPFFLGDRTNFLPNRFKFSSVIFSLSKECQIDLPRTVQFWRKARKSLLHRYPGISLTEIQLGEFDVSQSTAELHGTVISPFSEFEILSTTPTRNRKCTVKNIIAGSRAVCYVAPSHMR